MSAAPSPGPFAGLKVVEFGRFIAAPYCCQLLADGGADVVKVEPLEGDETRRNGAIIPFEGRQYLNKNRGKRSLSVDLGDAEVRRAVQELAASADVVVCNFRPGQSEKLGLDWDSLSSRNPRLIYAENTAFGRRGPMAERPGMDLMMVAYSGLAPVGSDGPVDLENPIVDYTAALLLAFGVATALYHRERTGRGQRVDVSLLHAALVVQNNTVNHVDVIDEWRHEYLRRATDLLANGASWEEVLAVKRALQPHSVSRAYYGFFRTGDGVIAVSALGRQNQRRLLEVLGVRDRWVEEPGWLPDDAAAHNEAVATAVEERFRTRSTAAWVEELQAAGVPASPVRMREELLDDEQAWANDVLVRLEHDAVGGMTVVAPPVALSETPLRAERASPRLGADTEAVLREVGLSDAQIHELAERGLIRTGD